MKKKLFILLGILLLTGCKANYHLQINLGGNVIETSSIYLNSSMLGRDEYPSDSDEFLDQIAEEHGFKFMKKIKFEEGAYLGYKTYRRYGSVSSYVNQSPAITVLYNNLTVTKENNHVILKSDGDNKIPTYHNPTGDIPTTVERIEISITLPYKVLNHNANSSNSENNTYTWVFDPSDAREFLLEYTTDELYTSNPTYLFQFVSPYVYISAFLVIIILIVLIVARNKYVLANKI